MSTQNRYNIMLTDDNPLLRKELKQFIEEYPELKICGDAGNDPELLGLLMKLSGRQQEMAHLVILDISMPYLGGLETARQGRLMHPPVKILFLSNHDSKEDFKYAIDGVAEDYLLKSEMDTELLPAIRTIRSGDFYDRIENGTCSDAGAYRDVH